MVSIDCCCNLWAFGGCTAFDRAEGECQHKVQGGSDTIVIAGHMHIVQFLLDCGAEIDLADAEGHTPLGSLRDGEGRTDSIFMTRRPYINILGCKGRSILLDCAAAGKLLPATILLENGADINLACDG